ncbi:prepilin-type N-terminal cleavage/methylation domain-containing protein [Patescibacteria group bacterium]|nr:prepilin-type N-terminal cleavage/methylation domain-containing protein [Patescibacteria group bacterium]
MVQRNAVKVLRGFSLMELLVVIGIFSTISVVILANHSKFNSSVLLGNLAYSIAVSVREAQVYGVSVQQYNSSFKSGYGVHVEAGNGAEYIFFADTNGNKTYDKDADAIVKRYTLNAQHSIVKFCGIKSTGVEECSDGSTTIGIDNLDIVFFRPDPDAYISSDRTDMYSSAKIAVGSTAGEMRTVSVASTGQIAVSSGNTFVPVEPGEPSP